MACISRRESANRDLIALWVWYAENAGIDTADRFLSAVEATLSMLAREPASGTRVVTKVAKLQGMRRFPVAEGFGKILLFYFPLPDGIDLVRVIHGSRDLEALLA